MGRIPSPSSPWGGKEALKQRMQEADLPKQLWLATSGLQERYSPRERLFNLSDRMEAAMGRIPLPSSPWGGKGDLKQRLQGLDPPPQLWLASSGPPQAMERKLKPLQSQAEQAGYRCEPQASDLSHARLLRCQFEARGRSE